MLSPSIIGAVVSPVAEIHATTRVLLALPPFAGFSRHSHHELGGHVGLTTDLGATISVDQDHCWSLSPDRAPGCRQRINSVNTVFLSVPDHSGCRKMDA